MTIDKKTGLPFPRGLVPSPKARRAQKSLFVPAVAAPSQIAWLPAKLSYWYNNQYGICVTSEEAFAKGCSTADSPVSVFIPDAECKRWAQSHGWLNGASLVGVMEDMREKGFQIGSQVYSDGDFSEVQFDNEEDLKAALGVGPVKIAIDADALPGGAGNETGWFTISARTYRGTDHCVALNGFGTAKWLYEQLAKAYPTQGISLPAGLPADTFGYLCFTWGTIGFVTFKWITGTTDEAYVRQPLTIGVPPLTPPNPPPPAPPVVPHMTGSFRIDADKIRGECSLTLPDGSVTVWKIVPAGLNQFVFEPKLPS